MQRISGIDGLRAVAVTLVLLAHFGMEKYVPGGFGVTLFFFISGFLITSLLVKEYEKTGQIKIYFFYMRRLIRLYPALLFSAALSIIVYTAFGGVVTLGEIAASLFYYANYYQQSVGFGAAGAVPVGSFHPLSILWSLAIEEQYYLLFPIAIAPFIKSTGKLMALFMLLAILSLFWRVFLQSVGLGDRIYMATDTRIDSIIYGAILATMLMSSYKQRALVFLTNCYVVWLAVFLLMSSLLVRDEFFRNTFRYSVQGISLLSLVCFVCFSNAEGILNKILNCKPVILVGAWSYSLYLCHGIAILIAENIFSVSALDEFNEKPFLFFLCEVFITLMFSIFSYYVIEMRFIKLRKHFGSQVTS